jgi:outer membrane lipoprotein-sorting protein
MCPSMNRRTLLAAASAALMAVSLPAFAQDGRDLARISAYLNGVTTLKGDFVQIDPDGILSEGQFFMRRPGRIRFEYNAPNPALVVADGFWVGVIDKRYDKVTRYPLSETPLNLILKENVNLSAEGAITQIERSDGQMRVHAQDPDYPERGKLIMVFGDNPLELRQWIIDDPQGGATTVALSDTRAGVEVPGSLFIIPNGDGKGRNADK